MPPRPRTSLLLGVTLMLGLLVLGPAAAATAANAQVCIGVVIDNGPNSTEQNWAPVAVQAAQVAPGSSDLQALAAAGDIATQNNSGLVCAIDNFPADGLQNCLSTKNGQYYYWAYWEGDPYTNKWTYASIGPASHTVGSGQTYVEGWSFQDPGPDNATAPPPSVTPAAAFAQTCPGVQPVPSGGSGGSGGSAGSGGSGGGSGGGGSGGGGTSGSGTSAGPASSSATAPVASGSAPARTSPIGIASAGNGAPTTTTHPGVGRSPASAGAHGASTTTTVAGSGTPSRGGGKTALADPRGHGTSGGGGSALPIVLAAALIVLLGGLAWWRWRRRPAEE